MNDHPSPHVEHRRLVQQIVDGGIPTGKDFDACREILRTDSDDDAVFQALFTLLQGALADPFFGIEDTRRVVPVLKALARGEVTPGKLM